MDVEMIRMIAMYLGWAGVGLVLFMGVCYAVYWGLFLAVGIVITIMDMWSAVFGDEG